MAPDPNILHALLLTALRALPDIGERIYDGIVPDSVPTAGGYIRPYAVVFTGLGSDLPEERDLTRLTDTGVLDWAPQINVAAADATTCRRAAQQVRAALTNLPLGSGWLMPDPDGFRINTPLKDSGVTPARMYLPLPWRLTTT